MAARLNPPERIAGPTPSGGAYAIVYVHDDGIVELVEFDALSREIMRSYAIPEKGKRGQQ
jgi:hypothetical protein